jgi:hypothetical protein
MTGRAHRRLSRRAGRAERPRCVRRRIVLGFLACLLLAACSGGAAATAPASGTSAPGVAGAAPSTASPAPGESAVGRAAGAVDVCAVVTAVDAAPLFSGPATASAETGLTGAASGCSYASTQSGEGFAMEVVTGDSAALYWTGNTSGQGEDTIPLSGIGDHAMRAPGTPDIVSIKGSVFCEVEVGSEDGVTLAGLATPDASDNVPDDSATAFAQRLGALCNKVFASQ